MLIAGILLGLLLGLRAGGRLNNLANIQLRWPLLLIAAVLVRYGTEALLNAHIDIVETLRGPLLATGFALALDNLQWALVKSGNPWTAALPPRVAIAGPAREIAAEAIRAQGIDAATLPGEGLDVALAFARAWGYDAALVAGANAWQVIGTDGVVADAVSDADTLRVWLGME